MRSACAWNRPIERFGERSKRACPAVHLQEWGLQTVDARIQPVAVLIIASMPLEV